eukprot:1022540-Rhodomonas_salina.1
MAALRRKAEMAALRRKADLEHLDRGSLGLLTSCEPHTPHVSALMSEHERHRLHERQDKCSTRCVNAKDKRSTPSVKAKDRCSTMAMPRTNPATRSQCQRQAQHVQNQSLHHQKQRQTTRPTPTPSQQAGSNLLLSRRRRRQCSQPAPRRALGSRFRLGVLRCDDDAMMMQDGSDWMREGGSDEQGSERGSDTERSRRLRKTMGTSRARVMIGVREEVGGL